MFNNELLEKLRSVTAEVLGIDEGQLTDDASAKTIPEWTSFNHLTLMTAIEDTFDTTFSMEEMTELQTYKDLESLVLAHVK